MEAGTSVVEDRLVVVGPIVAAGTEQDHMTAADTYLPLAVVGRKEAAYTAHLEEGNHRVAGFAAEDRLNKVFDRSSICSFLNETNYCGFTR